MPVALESLTEAVRESGLAVPGQSGVALVSGGPDSTALLAGLTGHCGPERVTALHLNYGLRPGSDEDERGCRRLAERLGVELVVERPTLPGSGNLQREAREARYLAAERMRAERGLDWIATGHTRTDLAETVLYRLAASPGIRPLLGLRARRAAVIRPLLGLDRARVRKLVVEAGLPFRDDPSNAEPAFARNRIRNEVLPVLGELGAVEANIAETQAELAEGWAALERLAGEALRDSGAEAAGAISIEALEGLDPALRRLALRSLAERAAGHAVVLGRERAAEILRLAGSSEGGVVELGGGIEARCEHGHVRFARAGAGRPPAESRLTVPGSCRFGSWEVRAELSDDPVEPTGPDAALLDPGALAGTLLVRPWRDGDRMRPLGLDGTKTLQDLFTDRKVPRSLRHTLPVVTSEGRIAWIAGVAVSEEFAIEWGSGPAAVLRASLVSA